MRIVPVPSDPGTGSVFVYENLGEGIGRLCRKCSDLRPERKKKVRDPDSLDYPSMVEIVAQPKPDNASICQMAVKIERLEEGVEQQLTALLLVFARRKLHRAS
jgi:hypothetical protein